MATKNEAGVTEHRGRCRIYWNENGKQKFKVLDIPYSRAGIEKALRVRGQLIKDFKHGITEEINRGPSPTFGELAQQRLDILGRGKPSARKSTKSRLNNYWMPVFDKWPITQIRYSDIQAMMQKVYRKNLSNKTMKEILTDGSGVFELAIKSQWINENPTKLVNKEIKTEKKEIDPFTHEEMNLLLKALPDNLRLFYLIRYYCGMRPGEVIALRHSDYRDGHFRVTRNRVYNVEGTTKTGNERLVPVHPIVQKAITDAPRVLHSDHIVNNQYGQPFTSSNNTGRALVRAMELTGVRYRDPYNVRHSCAARMLEAGCLPSWCANVLGHSIETFYRVYASIINRAKIEEQSQIWASMD